MLLDCQPACFAVLLGLLVRLVLGTFGAEDSDNKVNVQVILRCRPLLQREIDESAESILTCRRNEVEVSKYATYVQRKVYLFHRVFSESTQQRQLYRQSIRPLVVKVCALGWSACM